MCPTRMCQSRWRHQRAAAATSTASSSSRWNARTHMSRCVGSAVACSSGAAPRSSEAGKSSCARSAGDRTAGGAPPSPPDGPAGADRMGAGGPDRPCLGLPLRRGARDRAQHAAPWRGPGALCAGAAGLRVALRRHCSRSARSACAALGDARSLRNEPGCAQARNYVLTRWRQDVSRRVSIPRLMATHPGASTAVCCPTTAPPRAGCRAAGI